MDQPQQPLIDTPGREPPCEGTGSSWSRRGHVGIGRACHTCLPGVVSWREDGTPLSVLAFTVVDGRITGITVMADSSKLALMDLPDPA
ncbi:hypothetical protein ACWIGY_21255 [Streptomyces anulatus]